MLELLPVAHERPERRREGHQSDEEELPVEVDQHGDSPHQRDDLSEPRERRFGRYALDLTDVPVDAGDDVTERGPGVEARGKALEMPIQVQAHVEEDIRGNPGVAHPAEDVQDERSRSDADEEPDDTEQGGEVLG